MRLPLFPALLLLSGCITMASIHAEQHQKALNRVNALVGKNVHQLVSEWGPPSSITPNGASSVYLWTTHGAVETTGFGSVYGFGASSTQEECRTWFDVDPEGAILGAHLSATCY